MSSIVCPDRSAEGPTTDIYNYCPDCQKHNKGNHDSK